MKVITGFIQLYRLYRKHHGRSYSLRRAWDISITGLPF
jgi:hypothetical protein